MSTSKDPDPTQATQDERGKSTRKEDDQEEVTGERKWKEEEKEVLGERKKKGKGVREDQEEEAIA